jgi:hypothetical protein
VQGGGNTYIMCFEKSLYKPLANSPNTCQSPGRLLHYHQPSQDGQRPREEESTSGRKEKRPRKRWLERKYVAAMQRVAGDGEGEQ